MKSNKDKDFACKAHGEVNCEKCGFDKNSQRARRMKKTIEAQERIFKNKGITKLDINK